MGNEQPQHRPRPKRRRPRGQAPDGTPVVRLDIYATSEGAGPRQVPTTPPPAAERALGESHAAAVDLADVERQRRRLAAQEEALSERTHELRRLEQQLEEREAKLAEREAHIRLELDLKEDELEGREQALADQEQRLVRK